MGENKSKHLRLLEKLELIIPGFKGYKQKELLREDDRLIRNKIADMLVSTRKELEKILEICISTNSQSIEAIDKIRKKIMMLENKIRHAPCGYSGFFDRIKIKEEELNKLIEFDSNLISNSEEILSLVKDLKLNISNQNEINSLILKIMDKLDELENLIDKRNELLQGGDE